LEFIFTSFLGLLYRTAAGDRDIHLQNTAMNDEPITESAFCYPPQWLTVLIWALRSVSGQKLVGQKPTRTKAHRCTHKSPCCCMKALVSHGCLVTV